MKNYIKLFLATALAMSCLVGVQARTGEETRLHPRTGQLISVPGSDKKVESARVLPPKIRTAAGANMHVFREAKHYIQPRERNFVSAESAPAVRGALIFSESWGTEKNYGIYELAPGAAAKSIIPGVQATDGGVVYQNCFYAHRAEPDDFFGGYTTYVKNYDLETCKEGDYDEYAFNGKPIAIDLAVYNYYDDLFEKDVTCIIGIFWTDDNHDSYCIGKLEYRASGPYVTQLANLPNDWCAIAVNSKNEVYAIQREIDDSKNVVSSTLWKIVNMTDLAERMADVVEAVRIGETGVLPYFMSSACFDPNTDRLYWNVCPSDGSGSLYEVDTQTGAATKMYDFSGNEEVIGMYIPKKIAGDLPEIPEDLVFDFKGGSLSGTVSFKAPQLQTDGKTPLSGQLSYEITANGLAVASGTCSPGETVADDITLPSGGKYSFAVTVSNENGSSAALKADFTAGFATPYAPGNVHMELDDDNNVTLTWAPVESGSDGYFNADEIRYRVTAYPGARIVEAATAATTITDHIEEAEGYNVYYYTVEAIMGDAVSAPASSNSVSRGHITPPYTEGFDSRAAFDGYSQIGENNPWFFYNNMAQSGKEGWLVTPPVALYAGNIYKISFDAKVWWSYYPETLEVRYGMAPTEEGLDMTIFEAFEVKEDNMTQYSAYITPNADGLYYIGFNHKVCEVELDLDNICIDMPVLGSVPAAPSVFTAYGDSRGAKKVNISLTVPDKTFDGNNLTSVTKVELYRDDVLCHTFDQAEPGQNLVWTDENPVDGVNVYTAYVFNEYGRSEAGSATAFVGIDEPQAPTNIIVREISDGVVSVSWDPVTRGIHGNPMDPDLVKYDVGVYNGVDLELNVTDISETEAVFRAIPEGMQDFIQIAVFADTETGESYNLSDQYPIGTPMTGYSESFMRGIVHNTIGISRTGNSAVNVYTDADGVPSQDADGGLLAIIGNQQNAKASVMSGKISLASTVKPALTFYSLTIADSNTGNTSNNLVEVDIAEAGSEYQQVFSKSVTEIGATEGWHKVVIPLDDFVGKIISFRISGIIINFSYTFFDNIRVGSTVDYDLAISNISAPSRVSAGEDYYVAVLYENRGLEEASEYVVGLYADGKLVASSAGEPMAAGASAAKRMKITMDPLAEEPVQLYASVSFAADANPDNNTSETVEIEPQVRFYPQVTDLNGYAADGKVTLEWSEPDYENYIYSSPMTESFEDGEPFATSYGDWIFVDADKLPVGGFKNLQLPGIEAGSLQSFWVFDDSNVNSTFDASTGHRYLTAMYAIGGPSDEWAISPELSGEQQYIGFYAKSYSSSISEKMEVFCSEGSTDITEFRQLLHVDIVPHDWTYYELRLPAGTRRFAVRYCANDAMMLMLDDFRFTPAGKDTDRLSLCGFNIYRDGIRINEKPVGDFSFTDDMPSAESTYVVTAVYTQGESRGSNAVVLGSTGIPGTESGRIIIRTDGGSIVVDGAEGEHISVFTVDGCTVFSDTANAARTSITVSDGIYIVKAGDKTAKVIVR